MCLLVTAVVVMADALIGHTVTDVIVISIVVIRPVVRGIWCWSHMYCSVTVVALIGTVLAVVIVTGVV